MTNCPTIFPFFSCSPPSALISILGKEEKSVKRKSHKNEQESPLAAQIKNRVLCVATWRLTHSPFSPNEKHSVETKRSQKMCCNSEDDDDDESGWWPGWKRHTAHTLCRRRQWKGTEKRRERWHKISRTNSDYRWGRPSAELTWNMEKMLSMNLFMLIGETNSCSNIAHFSWFALLPDPAERVKCGELSILRLTFDAVC